MGIQIDDDSPTEVTTIMESKSDKYSCDTNENNTKTFEMKSSRKFTEVTGDALKRKVRKKKSKKANQFTSTSSSTDCDDNITTISERDLIRLRKVYTQCKSMMRKMKQKYGHLLELSSSDSDTDVDSPYKKRSRLEKSDENECLCTVNKKIVFDEEGNEASMYTLPSNHICPTKLMSKNQSLVMKFMNPNVEIEHNDEIPDLSDDVQELRNILKDPMIETSYRNLVIEKLKLIKQEHMNEIRFKKLYLIEKLKSNPDEIFTFNGSNLAMVTGYFY